MKTLIVTFSQSGHTRSVAKQIGTGIGGAAGECEIVELEEAEPGALASFDIVGLGCPDFFCQEP